MTEEILQRLLGIFESQSRGLARVAGLFVLAVVFLQSVFLGDYVQLNHVLEKSQAEQQNLITDRDGIAGGMIEIDGFRKQLATSTGRAKALLRQFPMTLRQGILNVSVTQDRLGGISSGEISNMPQMTAQMAQSMPQMEQMPDLPMSRAIDDIQEWINHQFVIINKDINAQVKQLLVQKLAGLRGHLDEDESAQLKEMIASIEVKQPQDRRWWRKYSGKMAMSEASINDISTISGNINRTVGDIHNATNNLWSEIDSKLTRLRNKREKQALELKALEDNLQSTLAGLKSSIAQIGLPFGDMVPVNLSAFLKVYPILLLASVVWLFARMMKLLVIRQEILEINIKRTDPVKTLNADRFDRIYAPWLIKPFVNTEVKKKTLTSAIQLLSVSLVVFLLPMWSLGDLVYRINTYPSEVVAGVEYVYVVGFVLLIAIAPVFYSQLKSISECGREEDG